VASVGKEHILVINDVERRLEAIGAEVGDGHVLTTFDNPSEAVEHLTNGVGADLILVLQEHLSMPLLDLFRLACDASARQPDFVILESGSEPLDYRDFPPDSVDFINADAPLTYLAARIERILLHRRGRVAMQVRIGELNQKLQASDVVLVETLIRCSAYKDDEYGRHVQRINEYSTLLAKLHGMPDSYARNIGLASMLHDIGKVSIPDGILQKPGKLSEDEWELVKQHCTEGAGILGDPGESALLAMTRRIILSHHEKWDGTGYPAGLSGREIHLEGRIVGLADVLDALTTDLPYKKAWSFAEATRYIRSQSGVHFDPELVGLFLENASAFDEIRVRLADILVEEEAAERR
jgi:putative two-component system response regulator